MADDMLSSFSNLYLNRPREAEHGDTRHEIRRHDPDQEKRKRGDEEKKSGGLFNEDDSATVSVEALRLFLQNFLASLEPQAKTTAVSIPDTPSSPRPVQGNAAHAAHAYAHASETKPANRFIEPPPQAQTTSLNLPGEDVRVIHRLLQNLKILSENGTENIRIERADTFLQSLVSATDKALGL